MRPSTEVYELLQDPHFAGMLYLKRQPAIDRRRAKSETFDLRSSHAHVTSFATVVPVALLLLSLAALALILYLQEPEEYQKSFNGEEPKIVSNSGGTIYVEDDEGHTVRRSKRCVVQSFSRRQPMLQRCTSLPHLLPLTPTA